MAKIKPNELKTLIFSGAGALGVAYAGCVKALNELGALKNVTTFGGSSAGSIISYALALGFTWDELYDVTMNTNFGDFLYSPVFKKKPDTLQKILTQKGYAAEHKVETLEAFAYLGLTNGLSSNDRVKDFLEGLCKKKFNNQLLTLQQLYNKTRKTLVVTGCDIGTREEKYNDYKSAGTVLASDAVLASMSIPYVFPPVKLYPNEDNCVIDGGTLNNLPVNIGEGTPSLYIVIGEPINKMGDFHPTKNLEQFTINLVNTILNNAYQYIFSQPEIVEKTIQVPIPSGLGALSFDMTREQKLELYNNGYNAVKNYFAA
jgi:NTE family protein